MRNISDSAVQTTDSILLFFSSPQKNRHVHRYSVSGQSFKLMHKAITIDIKRNTTIKMYI